MNKKGPSNNKYILSADSNQIYKSIYLLFLIYLIIVVAHGVIVITMYKARIHSRLHLADSDIIVFWLPFLFSFMCAFVITARFLSLGARSRAKRYVWSAIIALLITFISFGCNLLIVFNLYGT